MCIDEDDLNFYDDDISDLIVDPDKPWETPGYDEIVDPSCFTKNPDEILIDKLLELLHEYPDKKVYSFLCTLIGRQDLESYF